MKIDRMELADCGTPDTLVVAILKQIPEMPIPVPIEEIAHQLDIREIRIAELEGFEGGLVAFEDKSVGTILVNQSSNRQRRRFTIGHELGHFVNPWHKPKAPEGFRCTSQDMRMSMATPRDRGIQMEVEANRFAAGILLPLPYFRKDLANLKIVDVEHILNLSKRYDMSKESTARRYVEEHNEPCAAIVSQNGKLLRCYRHGDFPFVDFEKGDPVPRGSVTASANIPEGQIINWTEIDGGLWLRTQRGQRSPSLYEQVLSQRNGFRLTLLTLDDDGNSFGEEDAENLEESWTPKFRRR